MVSWNRRIRRHIYIYDSTQMSTIVKWTLRSFFAYHAVPRSFLEVHIESRKRLQQTELSVVNQNLNYMISSNVVKISH